MGNRRRIRRYRNQLILLIAFCSLFGQAEYQITTIPLNSFMLSTHNGFEPIDNNSKYLVSYLQYPDQIDLLSIDYNKINFSLLNYGLFEDKVDQIINNQFHAYEGLINYNFKKRIFDLFSLKTSIGGIFSKMESYTSIALIVNTNLRTTIPTSNIKLGFALKNLGVVLKNYTENKQQLPMELECYILKKINDNMSIGYHLDYLFYIDHMQHIILTQFKINQSTQLRLSSTSYSQDLSYDNKLIHGLAIGISINTQNKSQYDFSVSNLGIGGYIYGITMQF